MRARLYIIRRHRRQNENSGLTFREVNMRTLKAFFAVTVSLFLTAASARAQHKELSDSQYITQALSAAPQAVAKGAAVVRVEKDGNMREVRPGNNGFTCLIMDATKMCNDRNSMEFIGALMKHQPPSNKVGISYMLAGDKGASNTDPYAMSKT